MEKYDVVIIGAGAAGLMCAIEAGKRGRKTLVIEKADKPAKKIRISGGGRCNFTNLYASPDNYLSSNPHFCKSALSRYSPWDFIALMEKHELSWHEKKMGQLFCDQKSPAIINMLLNECASAGVQICLKTKIDRLTRQDEKFLLNTQNMEIESRSVVIATGGPSIPKMGASDFALRLAAQFDLDAIPFTAALVPFALDYHQQQNEFLKELTGIAVPVELSTVCAKRTISFVENILFTHRGISGPAALQLSSYWSPGNAININFFPPGDAQTESVHVSEWLTEQQRAHPDAEFKTLLMRKLPKRLAQNLCEHVLDQNICKLPIKQITPVQFDALARQLSNWQLFPSGTEGMRTAEVSRGGVNTDELSSKTFECRSVKGLYFIGESVDVTGHLGGFNFQWAWASGWCAGQFV